VRDGSAELDAIIARIRNMGSLAKRAAPDVAEAVHGALDRQIVAGMAPDGVPWAPRKADGGRPLVGAEKGLVVVPVGSKIIARIRGHIARHNLGRARGGVVRRILPDKGIPPAIAHAIRPVLDQHFREIAEGK
jgi:hypothetical protein